MKPDNTVAIDEDAKSSTLVSVAGGGGGGWETRIARMESDVEYIKRDIFDIKSDIRDLRNDIKRIDGRIDSQRAWFIAIFIGLILGFGGIIASIVLTLMPIISSLSIN